MRKHLMSHHVDEHIEALILASWWTRSSRNVIVMVCDDENDEKESILQWHWHRSCALICTFTWSAEVSDSLLSLLIWQTLQCHSNSHPSKSWRYRENPLIVGKSQCEEFTSTLHAGRPSAIRKYVKVRKKQDPLMLTNPANLFPDRHSLSLANDKHIIRISDHSNTDALFLMLADSLGAMRKFQAI